MLRPRICNRSGPDRDASHQPGQQECAIHTRRESAIWWSKRWQSPFQIKTLPGRGMLAASHRNQR